jgi:hypothetical protein
VTSGDSEVECVGELCAVGEYENEDDCEALDESELAELLENCSEATAAAEALELPEALRMVDAKEVEEGEADSCDELVGSSDATADGESLDCGEC